MALSTIISSRKSYLISISLLLTVSNSIIVNASLDYASLLNASFTVWEYSPNYSNDTFPPYPPLTHANGTNIDVQALRGTRLYGWKGCEVQEQKDLAQAYDDFYKLAQQTEVYNNIVWDDQAAKEFFGPAFGVNKIPDARRKQIQQIFNAAQQVWHHTWVYLPPWDPLSMIQSLWIEVRCSGGDETGDPDNVCGDKKPNDGQCPGGGTPSDGSDNTMEAWSNPSGRYSQITFCSRFFNDLRPLEEVIDSGKKKPVDKQDNLETWNSRARCFFHEVTHLTYFMNTPKQGPKVEDLQIKFVQEGKKLTETAYGPYNAKVLRNYVAKGKGGFYTQRNADTYAFFATAKYVAKQIGRYPNLPTPGSLRPPKAPRDMNGDPIAAMMNMDIMFEDGLNTDLIGTQELDAANQTILGYSVPGCRDNYPSAAAAKTIPTSSKVATTLSTVATPSTPPPPPSTSPPSSTPPPSGPSPVAPSCKIRCSGPSVGGLGVSCSCDCSDGSSFEAQGNPSGNGTPCTPR